MWHNLWINVKGILYTEKCLQLILINLNTSCYLLVHSCWRELWNDSYSFTTKKKRPLIIFQNWETTTHKLSSAFCIIFWILVLIFIVNVSFMKTCFAYICRAQGFKTVMMNKQREHFREQLCQRKRRTCLWFPHSQNGEGAAECSQTEIHLFKKLDQDN